MSDDDPDDSEGICWRADKVCGLYELVSLCGLVASVEAVVYEVLEADGGRGAAGILLNRLVGIERRDGAGEGHSA